jgi:hypothetical protein
MSRRTHTAESDRTVRASELASYVFCRRAWWYQRQGITPAQSETREAGLAWHRRHGRRLLVATALRAVGWILILMAVAGAAVVAASGLMS